MDAGKDSTPRKAADEQETCISSRKTLKADAVMKTYNPKVCDREMTLALRRSVAIKAYCTDCSAGIRTEVKHCPAVQCPLYPFRGFITWDKKPEITRATASKGALTEKTKDGQCNIPPEGW